MRRHKLLIAGIVLVMAMPALAQAETDATTPPVRLLRLPRATPTPEPTPTPTPTPAPTRTPAATPAPAPERSQRQPTAAQPTPQELWQSLLKLRATIVPRTEIVPPASAVVNARSGSVMLRAGPHSAVMKTLAVRRQVTLPQMRAKPRIALGQSTVDLAPMLANPRALFNVAQSIRSQPSLAVVVAENTRAIEVDRGLIVHSFLSYRIKPGTCSNPSRRALLGNTGIACATRLTDQSRAAAFADPRNPRYVSDPEARAKVLAEAATTAEAMDADFSADIAQLRASLANPAKRAEMDVENGPGEAARLATLSDEDLKSEIINTGETAVEQTAYIPNTDRVNSTTGSHLIDPAPKPPKPVKVDTPLSKTVFVTGFTMGRDYEWHQRIEKTIKRCVLGCKKTYYAEAKAGFNYAFGLRFPVQLTGLYSYREDNGTKAAKVRVDFTPVNGSEQDYRDSGMPEGKIHKGKELVATVGGHASFYADLPATPNFGASADPQLDFTELLPGDFYQGQITPPAPGAANPPTFEKFFDTIDLLGGRASFGIAGAKVFPAVKLALKSQSLNFDLIDKGKANAKTVLTATGQEVDLAIAGPDNVSSFSIGDPVYNLGFDITPGINARLYIDIAVWSHNWDFPMWFPQLTITLPPGGANFGCHAETICSRNYNYSPTGHSETAGAKAPSFGEGTPWGQQFDAKWLSQCADETCRVGIRFVRQGTIYNMNKKIDANPSASLDPEKKNADVEAKGLIDEAQMRQTQKASKSYGTLMHAIWATRCSDTLCLKNMKGIIFLAQWEMNAYQASHPDLGTNEVIGTAAKKFVPSLQAEVDASKVRAAAAQAADAKLKAKFVPIKPSLPKIKLQ